MPHKLNISEKGKAWKLESQEEILAGKRLGDKLPGKEISSDLEGYELEITGASDASGFPHKKDIDSPNLKRIILTKGWGMHKRPRRAGKKKVYTPHGLRLKKTVRGNQISEKTVQINIKVLKPGHKHLKDIFPEQNKPKETKSIEQKAEQAPEAKKPIETPAAT